MTATQISYWNYKESERHNLASENLTASDIAEKARHNRKTEKLSASELAENKRYHNQQFYLGKGNLKVAKGNLKVAQGQLKVSKEKNKIDWANVNEKIRSNMAQEGLKGRELDLRSQELAQKWYDIVSLVGLRDAQKLAQVSQADLNNTRNRYYVYELLAKTNDVGKWASILGITTSGLTKEDKDNFKSYFAQGYSKPKNYKPSNKFAAWLDRVLDKLSTTNWTPIVTM